MAARFMKSSGIVALAAGLVLAAVPANAQDREWRGRGGGAEAAARAGGHERGVTNRGPGAWQRGRQAAEGQQAQQAPQQREWSGRRGDGDNDRGSWRGRERAPSPVVAAPVAPAANEARAQRGEWSGRNRDYTDAQRNRTYRDGARDGNWRDGSRDGNWRDGRRDASRWSNDARRWDRDWRRDNRYDWSRHRTTNRNVFRLGTYYSPYRNYSYRRVGIGFALDSLFFGSRYWISDPWQYRLPAVYGPYRWVRYFDDVLLVDTYTGEVVDVIYDFFW